MVCRRMGVRNQDRGAACRRDLHDRAARAGDHEVSGGEDVAKVRLVLQQRVALRSALLVPAPAQLRVIATADDVEDPRLADVVVRRPRRLKASKAAKLIERAPRLPPTTVTQSAGSGNAEAAAGDRRVGLEHRHAGPACR